MNSNQLLDVAELALTHIPNQSTVTTVDVHELYDEYCKGGSLSREPASFSEFKNALITIFPIFKNNHKHTTQIKISIKSANESCERLSIKLRPIEHIKSTKDPQAINVFDMVDIYYATDRKIMQSNEPMSYFGDDIESLSFGATRVSIPSSHKPGTIETPSILRAETPLKHIMLLGIQPLATNKWLEKISSNKSEAAIVFIHGFNVSFDEAVRRAAQFKNDINYLGQIILYSWPSKGRVVSYSSDEETIELTSTNLESVLVSLLEQCNISKVHALAHSMGSRALVNVLLSLSSKQPQITLNQVILAAPDINSKQFYENYCPSILKSAEKFSLYVSSKDKALKASKKLHQYPRLGESGKNIVVIEGIDTIDASNASSGFLEHGYFAESKQVIDDLFLLINHGHPPDKRNLKPCTCGADEYWELP